MRSPEEVYQDWQARRQGILRALTSDVDRFYEQCDPARENLCLYGNPDGSWVVDLPAEEVPPEMPEPALGINFARDGMQKRDWLALVAVHSDTWLLSVAFYHGARLNKDGRDRLFELINEKPTCYEIVAGRVAGAKKRTGPPAGAAAGGSKPKLQHQPQHQPQHQQRAPMMAGGSGRGAGGRPNGYEDYDDAEPDEGEGYRDGEGDPCPNCGRIYRQGDFWIACDFCDTWYDGKCVGMTQQKAERMGKWKCPKCLRREGAKEVPY